MSLEWARARARANAARLALEAELEARSKVVQHPIGPLLSWRPSCAQAGLSAADKLLSAATGAHRQPAGGAQDCGPGLPVSRH
jgi:hypothetical protein